MTTTMSITEQYLAANPQSHALHERARKVLPGGIAHDVRHLSPFPLTMSHAEGAYKWDVDGHRYIDYVVGHGALLLGHSHPEIVAAVQQQAARGTHLGAGNEFEIAWAEQVQRLIPSADLVKFTSSGTEATMMAFRLARAHTGKTKILKFAGHFHGWHDYATIAQQLPWEGAPSPGVPEEVLSTVVVAPTNDLDFTEARLAEGDIAAVILEASGASWSSIPHPPGYLQRLRAMTEKHGVVLIFDEVVTGFRIAWGGAQERYGVQPDLATYGKAMSGGFPMAALAGRHDVMASLDARRTEWSRLVWASGTLNGNPISASAGLAALDLLSRPGTYQRLHEVGGRLRREIKRLGTQYGFAVQTPGEDAVFGVRFTGREPLRTWQDLLTADKDLGLRWAIELIRRGILVNPNEKFYISLVHTDEDVDKTLAAAEAVFAELKRTR